MIQIIDLQKKFGNFKAIEDLSITIYEGESYGFLGPNGAGKTTTMLIILGLIKPTGGCVKIDGRHIDYDATEIKRLIGYSGDNQAFFEEMTIWEYLDFFGRLYNFDNYKKRAVTLLEKVELITRKDSLIKELSTGMKKKLGFVRSIIHNPKILILDEPVSGLDPFGIKQVRELLIEEKNQGTTIIISSHILSEIEKTVDKVGIIAKGKMIAEGTFDDLRNRLEENIELEIELVSLKEEESLLFEGQKYIKSINYSGNTINLQVDNSQDYRAEIIKLIIDNGLIPIRIEKKESSLENALITITEKNLPHLTTNLREDFR